MADEDELEVPKVGLSDRGISVVKAALSAVPVIGGPAVEIFNALITPPLEKRKQKWMEDVGEALSELQRDKEIDLSNLQDNEKFIDIIMTASHAALRTSQEEKRLALKNVIINAAEHQSIDGTLESMYISLIDGFTDWHIRILRFIQKPSAWTDKNGRSVREPYIGGSILSILEQAFPEFQGNWGFAEKVWRDLYQAGLVSSDTNSLYTHMSDLGAMFGRTTDLGNSFLKYISR